MSFIDFGWYRNQIRDRRHYFSDLNKEDLRSMQQTVSHILSCKREIIGNCASLGDRVLIPVGRKMGDSILQYLKKKDLFRFQINNSGLIEIFKSRRHDEFSKIYSDIFKNKFEYKSGSKMEGELLMRLQKKNKAQDNFLSHDSFCICNSCGTWEFFRIFDYSGHEFLDGYYKSFFEIPSNDVQEFLNLLNELTQEHFLTNVMNESLEPIDVGSSFSLESYVLTPTFKQLYGDIEKFLKNQKFYEENHIPYKRGCLLIGPPGNGKTHSFRYILEKFKMPVIVPQEMSDASYYIKEAFESAKQVFEFTGKPVLLFLEEINVVLETRAGREILLEHLDGIKNQGSYYFIGTTNKPEDIDPALMNRPSRIDLVLEVKSPDEQTRYNFFEQRFTEWPKEIIRVLAKNTEMFSFAFLHNTYLDYMILNEGKNLNAPLMDNVIKNQREHMKLEAAHIETENKKRKKLGFED